ncbi:MAG: DUF4249 domain-containing protein, partial [Gemmatimonadota bacterium]|nr:DUF4249 domain-containing protein [Gemmatimonadota bacterium]
PLAAGCELTEVTAARGEDLLVVESVLRPDRAVQAVLLHRTVEGSTVRGEPGAQVVVRTGAGREIVFREGRGDACYWVDPRYEQGADSIRVEATCYVSPRQAGRWVVPGERYELAVVTLRGERVRGSTRLPGAYQLPGLSPGLPVTGRQEVSCTLPPDRVLPLVWTSARGAWAYLTEVEVYGLRRVLAGRGGITSVPEPLSLTGVSVSEKDTTLVVPTEVGVFDRFVLDQELLRAIRGGFPAGVRVQITLAATDRNFVNSVRGGAFNPSGNVHVSSVVGDAVGVFGSLVPHRLLVDVVAGGGDRPCLRG